MIDSSFFGSKMSSKSMISARSTKSVVSSKSIIQKSRHICLLCCENLPKKTIFFSQCSHSKICVTCGEAYMLSQINQGKIPRCPVQNCESQINMNQHSLYRYFSQFSKQKLRQFLRGRSRIEQPFKERCKKQNCRGTIYKLRCLKCLQHYCQICGQPSHSIMQPCQPKGAKDKEQGISYCPFCHLQYVKTLGCNHIKCPKCSFEFCQFCNKPWSFGHYTCVKGNASKNDQINKCSIY